MRAVMAVVWLLGIGLAPAAMAEEPQERSAAPTETVEAPSDAPVQPALSLTPEALIGSAMVGSPLGADPRSPPARLPEPSSILSAVEEPGPSPAAAEEPVVLADDAPPLRTEVDVRALCERFLQHIIAGQFDSASGLLRPYYPISQSKYTKLESETKAQLDLAEEHFGSPLGSVLIKTQNLDNTVLKFRFLQKFEYDVLYWDFIFYKPHEHWLFNGIGFDDDVQSLFR